MTVFPTLFLTQNATKIKRRVRAWVHNKFLAKEREMG